MITTARFLEEVRQLTLAAPFAAMPEEEVAISHAYLVSRRLV